jgi:hypothetical protein
MIKTTVLAALGLAVALAAAVPASAAPAFNPKNFSGIWMQDRATGRFPAYPWTPDYGAVAAKRKAASDAGNPYQPAGSSCLPRGLVGMVTTGAYPLEIWQEPGKIAIIKENGGVHRIYLNRKHQGEDDLTPLFYGDSVGTWDGNTLVVDSISLGATDNIDGQNPHSDAMHVVERYTRTAPDKLEMKMTVTDPKAFTAPISTVSTFTLQPKYEMQEYYCVNERNTFGKDGQGVAGTK